MDYEQSYTFKTSKKQIYLNNFSAGKLIIQLELENKFLFEIVK